MSQFRKLHNVCESNGLVERVHVELPAVKKKPAAQPRHAPADVEHDEHVLEHAASQHTFIEVCLVMTAPAERCHSSFVHTLT